MSGKAVGCHCMLCILVRLPTETEPAPYRFGRYMPRGCAYDISAKSRQVAPTRPVTLNDSDIQAARRRYRAGPARVNSPVDQAIFRCIAHC